MSDERLRREERNLGPAAVSGRRSEIDRVTGADIAAVYPEIIVTAVALIVLVADAVVDRRRAALALPLLTIAGLVVALASVFNVVPAAQYFRGFVTIDAFTSFFRAVFILLAIFAAAVSPAYLGGRRVPAVESYAIIFFLTVGAVTVAVSAARPRPFRSITGPPMPQTAHPRRPPLSCPSGRSPPPSRRSFACSWARSYRWACTGAPSWRCSRRSP